MALSIRAKLIWIRQIAPGVVYTYHDPQIDKGADTDQNFVSSSSHPGQHEITSGIFSFCIRPKRQRAKATAVSKTFTLVNGQNKQHFRKQNLLEG